MKYQLIAFLALLTTSTTAAAYDCMSDCHYYYNTPTGCYISLLGGANFLHMDDSIVDIDFDTGYTIGASTGYKFCNGVRLEGEFAFRRADFDDMWINGFVFDISGHSETTTLMANALYDFDLGTSWIPYVGLGIGYAHVHETAAVSDFGFMTSYTDDLFAWQAIAGISHEISWDLHLGLEYRYLHARDHTDDQTVNVVLRRFF